MHVYIKIFLATPYTIAIDNDMLTSSLVISKELIEILKSV